MRSRGAVGRAQATVGIRATSATARAFADPAAASYVKRRRGRQRPLSAVRDVIPGGGPIPKSGSRLPAGVSAVGARATTSDAASLAGATGRPAIAGGEHVLARDLGHVPVWRIS